VSGRACRRTACGPARGVGGHASAAIAADVKVVQQTFDWSRPGIVKTDQDTRQTVLPAERDADQDSVDDGL
jgi:hypothetical protein